MCASWRVFCLLLCGLVLLSCRRRDDKDEDTEPTPEPSLKEVVAEYVGTYTADVTVKISLEVAGGVGGETERKKSGVSVTVEQTADDELSFSFTSGIKVPVAGVEEDVFFKETLGNIVTRGKRSLDPLSEISYRTSDVAIASGLLGKVSIPEGKIKNEQADNLSHAIACTARIPIKNLPETIRNNPGIRLLRVDEIPVKITIEYAKLTKQ